VESGLDKIKVGIVGLGRLGKKHAENIAFRIPHAELTAICSIVKEEVGEIKRDWGIKYSYTIFSEMLENKELDAIFIASPSGEHCHQIVAALETGFHVLSEKPLGITLDECKLAEKAVEKHPDKIFMLGFMRRYDPSYIIILNNFVFLANFYAQTKHSCGFHGINHFEVFNC
jgi:myo-inositol 2-dehydrogenase/D-chiro-inositol 1-dehydrogenase